MQNRGQYGTVNVEMLVLKSHLYRKLEKLISFKKISYRLKKLTEEGYGKERIFKMLIIQQMEDLSDREMERYLQENVAAKYFCGFSLTDKTPDYTSFSKMRARIGTSQLSKIFTTIRKQLIKQGYIGEVFTFVDASHLIAKANSPSQRRTAHPDSRSRDGLNKAVHTAFALYPGPPENRTASHVCTSSGRRPL